MRRPGDGRKGTVGLWELNAVDEHLLKELKLTKEELRERLVVARRECVEVFAEDKALNWTGCGCRCCCRFILVCCGPAIFPAFFPVVAL